jgi:hypothetical protein
MNNLDKIPTIKKLADQFGTPLESATFIGKGIRFVYKVGDKTFPKEYTDADKGIQLEIERIQRFIDIS